MSSMLVGAPPRRPQVEPTRTRVDTGTVRAPDALDVEGTPDTPDTLDRPDMAGSLPGDREGAGASVGVRAAAAVAQLRDAVRVLACLAAEGRLVELPTSSLVELDESLHEALDRGTAVAAVATHLVHVTNALAGTGFASTSQWLCTRARVSKADARAELGRGFDLADRYRSTGDAWLAGEVSGAQARVLTRGLTAALRTVPLTEHDEILGGAQDILLDVARAGTVADVTRAVDRLRLAVDPDGAAQAAMDAYDEQSLTFRDVGTMTALTGWLTLETGAALRTLLEATWTAGTAPGP